MLALVDNRRGHRIFDTFAEISHTDGGTKKRIVKRLGALGVKLDKKANKLRGALGVISAQDSKIPVVVIPTNEELMIARDTVRVLKG